MHAINVRRLFLGASAAALGLGAPVVSVSAQTTQPPAATQNETKGAGSADIQVEQKSPQVNVQQPAPQITVEQPQPNVTVDQPQPKVTVEQAKPDVTVQQQGQPKVTVQEQGEPQVRIQEGQQHGAEHSGGQQGRLASMGKEIVGREVYGADNRNMGEVEDVIVGANGQLESILVDVGGFLGIGARRVAIPTSQITLGNDDRLTTTMTEAQVEELPEYNQ